MLSIFHVDRGQMLKVETSVAVGTVENLKRNLSIRVRIPPEWQILLVSGGTVMMNQVKVGQYNGGTDSNPIFLFSKPKRDKTSWCDWRLESSFAPANAIPPEEQRVLDLVDKSKIMRPSYDALRTKTTLAQKLYEAAVERTKQCKELVDEQHFQQQGWAAAVSNLEEFTDSFHAEWLSLRAGYEEYLKKRDYYVRLVENMPEDAAYLAKIPLLPCLTDNDEEDPSGEIPTTLLDWIGPQKLDDFAVQCAAGLETLDDRKLTELEREMGEVLKHSRREEYRQIKGLSDRLGVLDGMLEDAKKHERMQKDYWRLLQQSQSRADSLRDRDVLPDLCANHDGHLNEMVRNNSQLRSTHDRFVKAKEELCNSICMRLRWVVVVQQRIFNTQNRLKMFRESLRRLMVGLQYVEKIHLCPQLYLSGVLEVARRRAFSEAFLKWSGELASQAKDIYEEEVTVREGLHQQMSTHFLSKLFPGMNEFPPDFATNAPEVFDRLLPPISWADVQRLRASLPAEAAWNCPESLTMTLPKLQLENVTLMPLKIEEKAALKDGRRPSVDMFASAVEETLEDVREDAESVDDKTVDQEGDDEVFRTASEGEDTKDGAYISESVTTLRAVSESSGGIRRLVPLKTVSTSTDESLGFEICPSDEQYRLAAADAETKLAEAKVQLATKTTKLQKMTTIVGGMETQVFQLKADRDDLATCVTAVRRDLEQEVQNLTLALIAGCVNVARGVKTREEAAIMAIKGEMDVRIEELKRSHHNELLALRDELEELNARAMTDNEALKDECFGMAANLKQQQQEWEQEKIALLLEKDDEVKRLRDAMTLEMEVELENLRGAIQKQQHEELDTTKEELATALRDSADVREEKIALESLISRLKGELENRKEELQELRSRYEAEKEERKRDHLGHKVEIEALRSRCRMLTMTSSTISHSPPSSMEMTLTQSPAHGSRPSSLKDAEVMTESWVKESVVVPSDYAQSEANVITENTRLRTELEAARRRVTEMELMAGSMTASIVPCVPGEEVPVSDAELVRLNEALKKENASLRQQVLAMPRQTSSLLQSGKISLTSCNAGDVILVLWDTENHRYAIYQEGASNYFLHLDSVRDLGLATEDENAGTPKTLYMVAEVVQRETCLAKKDSNRYNLPKGFKFYRVRVKPWPKPLNGDQPTEISQEAGCP